MKTKLNFGEIFNYEGIDLKVVESNGECYGCYFVINDIPCDDENVPNCQKRIFVDEEEAKGNKDIHYYTSKQIAESDDLFEKQISKVKRFYATLNTDKRAVLEERKKIVSSRNKGITPDYQKKYHICGTCGSGAGAIHPITKRCFYCDTINWT